jgi:hypothetical protein
LAETKATKAIQKHSMNIDGRENFQIDEGIYLGKKPDTTIKGLFHR